MGFGTFFYTEEGTLVVDTTEGRENPPEGWVKAPTMLELLEESSKKFAVRVFFNNSAPEDKKWRVDDQIIVVAEDDAPDTALARMYTGLYKKL